MDTMKYPFTIANEQELVQHVADNIDSYKNILKNKGFDIVKYIQPANTSEINAHHTVQQVDELKKQLLEKEEQIQRKDKQLQSQKERCEHADRLIEKKKKYDEVQSSAKGKTFEEQIKYCLKNCKQITSLPCSIDERDRIKACDVRLDVQDFGIVGIEVKDKVTITKDDIDKFNKDRISNAFVASIFWSKNAEIPYLSLSKETLQDGDFVHVEGSVMYVCSDDIPSSVLLIYVFLCCLKASKLAGHSGEHFNLTEIITTMFDMLKNHYVALNAMKKQLKELDKMMVNDIEAIQKICSRVRKLKLPKITTYGHLYLVCKSSCLDLNSYQSKKRFDNKSVKQMFRKNNSDYNPSNAPLRFAFPSSSPVKPTSKQEKIIPAKLRKYEAAENFDENIVTSYHEILKQTCDDAWREFEEDELIQLSPDNLPIANDNGNTGTVSPITIDEDNFEYKEEDDDDTLSWESPANENA